MQRRLFPWKRESKRSTYAVGSVNVEIDSRFGVDLAVDLVVDLGSDFYCGNCRKRFCRLTYLDLVDLEAVLERRSL